MKLFGIEFGKKRQKNGKAVAFEAPSLQQDAEAPDKPQKKTILIAKLPRVKSPALSFKPRPGINEFEQPEYDMAEIGRIEDVEGFVSRAFTQKEGLMFKEGWELVGKNKETIKYIKQRFEQICAATSMPFGMVLRGLGEDLIRYSNAYLVKVRDRKASGGAPRKLPGKSTVLDPVAGYFPLPVSTMKFRRDDSGKILEYRQQLPTGRQKDFRPENIIHVYFKRKKGFLVGTPVLIPVKDDIRALRRIEENIEMLIYQHLFPLFHYKVGTEQAPAGTYPDGTREVDVVKQEIELMPAEGMIVTPERHEITAIGSEGRALRAEGYLTHFKKRVFAGLGVSAVDMGEGECYDDLTETLTENGWKFHDEIDQNSEKIATYNPETERIEFHIPNYKFEGHYTGDMITFQGKHLDIKVTPHHEMWVAPRTRGELKWRKVDAKDLYDGLYSEFYLLESALFDWAHIEDNPLSAGYEEEITLKASPRKQGRAKDITVRTTLFAKLIGYYLSEGCLDKHNAKNGHYRVVLSQNKGEVLDNMISLVEQMGLSYSVIHRNNRSQESGIRIYGRALYKFFESNIPGLAGEKSIPECIWFWGQSAREQLLQALIDGDGTRDTRNDRTSMTYYTTSKILANDVQILAMSLGYGAKVKEVEQSEESFGEKIFRVLISQQDKRQIIRIVSADMVGKESYDGTIYCYNVPNHLFVTRRNGKVTIQGNTANRSTADSMSRNMVDDVKHYQRTLELFINEYIIKELLLESTFEDPIDEENLVQLKFNEIDVEAKIKVENHAIQAFGGHALTHDELRRRFGQEPLSDEEWLNTYWKLIEEPKTLMQAVDEPYSAAAQALARTQNAEPSQADFDYEEEQRKKELEADRKAKSAGKPGPASTKPSSGQRAAKAATTPSNQHGKKSSPEKRKSWFEGGFKMLDMVAPGNKVTKAFDDLQEQTFYSLQKGTFGIDWFKQLATSTAGMMNDHLSRAARIKFRSGFRSIDKNLNPREDIIIFDAIEERTKRILDRFMNLLVKNIDKVFDRNDDLEIQHIKITSVFDAIRYRSRFIYNSECNRAYTYGRVRALRTNGYKEAELMAHETACDTCKAAAGVIELTNMTLDDIPSHHPNCTCAIVPITEK